MVERISKTGTNRSGARVLTCAWLPRWARLIIVGALVALAIDGAVLAWLHFRRPPAPPLSPVFGSAAIIRELQSMVAERPRDPEWHTRLGMAYLADSHYLSAIDSLEKGLRLGGPEIPIRTGLARAYTGVDRSEEALVNLTRLSALEPEKLSLRIEMAAEHARVGEAAKAMAVLDAVPRDSSGYPRTGDAAKSVRAMERLALAYGQLGRWDRCLQMARRVLKDAGDREVAAHVAAGRALLALGRPAEAASHLRAARRYAPGEAPLQRLLAQALLAQKDAKLDAEILPLLESAVAAGAAPGDAYFALGTLYEKRKDWVRAAAAFTRSHDVRTKSVQSLQRAQKCFEKAGKREEAIYSRGLLWETLQRYPEAIAAYRELTKIHSSCQSGYMHVARVQAQMGQARAAQATLRKALSLQNPPPKVYAELANASGAARDLETQRKMWEKFIKADPENADIGYQNLGAAADGGGKMDEAEDLYRKCVQLQPDADLYRIRLARLLLQRRNDPHRLREAVSHLERAVQLGRGNSEGFFQLGIAYRYAGRNLEAIWALRHAIDLDPGEGKSYQPLGELLMAVDPPEGEKTLALFRRYRQFYQAWETLKARATRNPKDVAAQRRLAAFYERSGAAFDAISVYARILDLQPGDSHAQKRLVELYRGMGQAEEDIRELHVERVPARGSRGSAG